MSQLTLYNAETGVRQAKGTAVTYLFSLVGTSRRAIPTIPPNTYAVTDRRYRPEALAAPICASINFIVSTQYIQPQIVTQNHVKFLTMRNLEKVASL